MRVLYFSLVVVIIDQLTKILVKGFNFPFLGIHHQGMKHGESFNVIGDFFRVTFVENPGMAFGIEVTPLAKLSVSLFSIIAAIGLLVYLYKVRKESLILRLTLASIFAGAVGNLIDRVFYAVFYGYGKLFYGKVVDFFDFEFFDMEFLGRQYDRFLIFNVADIAVSVGVIGLIILFWIEGVRESKLAKQAELAGDSVAIPETDSHEMISSDAEKSEENSEITSKTDE